MLFRSVNDANRTLTIAGNATISGTNTGDQTITLTGAVTGSGTGSIATTYSTVGVAYGGTGLTSYAIGDLIYASGATTLATIADVVAGKFLRSGGIGVAPAWSTLSLPNSATQGDILYATSANTAHPPTTSAHPRPPTSHTPAHTAPRPRTASNFFMDSPENE